MAYEDWERLINKYKTKQKGEVWDSKYELKNQKRMKMKEKIEIFEGINSQFFHLQGSQIKRAKYLIKHLDFNDICRRCNKEQIIVLICYFVKCEYGRYNREYCRKAFKEYNVSDNLCDRFMLYLARYGIENTKLGKHSFEDTI